MSVSTHITPENEGQPVRPPPWYIPLSALEIADEVLGEGGFATVKKGTFHGTAVAIKVLRRGALKKKFLDEVNIWERLRHEHVLQMFGACDTADAPFIVSKYMKNGNVMDYLERSPDTNRTRIAHEVALGMTYLHAQHVIHGDLKGANVLIDDAGKACITDFGISRIKEDFLAQTTTTKTDMAGSCRFMAPEQFQGKLIPPSDVYSYGMLLYQMFTGVEPFREVAPLAMYQIIVNEGRRLQRPTEDHIKQRGLTDLVWELIMDCSVLTRSERPTFQDVHRRTAAQLERPQPGESRSPGVDRRQTSPSSDETRRAVVPTAYANGNVTDPPLLLGSPRHSESMTPKSPFWKNFFRPGKVLAARADVPPPKSTRSQPSHSSDEHRTVIVRAADSDKLSKARRLKYLGDELRKKGEYASATRALTEAKTAYADVGERLGVAACLRRLGDIMRMQNQYAQATASADEARTIFKALGNGRGEAHCMWLRGEIMRNQGQYGEATATLEEAKDTYESLGSRHGVANCMRSLGDISLSQNRLGDALATLEAAKGIYKDLDNRGGVANCTIHLGIVMTMQKKYPESAALLEEAETLYKDLGAPAGVASCRQSQGDLMRDLNNFEGAVVAWKEAKQMYEDMGMPNQVRNCEAAINRVEAEINRADRGLLVWLGGFFS